MMKKLVLFTSLVICSLRVCAQLAVNDTAKFAAHRKDISIFLTAVGSAGINVNDMGSVFSSTIGGTQPATVFIPDNQAFEKLSPDLRDSLINPANSASIAGRLFSTHAIMGKMTAEDILKAIRLGNGKAVIPMLAGNKLTATINANRNIVLTDENGNQAIIKVFNIFRGDAVLYIISTVMMPKKQESSN